MSDTPTNNPINPLHPPTDNARRRRKGKSKPHEDAAKHHEAALAAAAKAHKTSAQTTRNPDNSPDAHQASHAAHRLHRHDAHLAKEAHERAVMAHEKAADLHDDFADDYPDEAHLHELAADQHREAADHHQEAIVMLNPNGSVRNSGNPSPYEQLSVDDLDNLDLDPTFNGDPNLNPNFNPNAPPIFNEDTQAPNPNEPTVNGKKLHRMSDQELHHHHREILAEKNRRDMNNFMGLTYQNPGEQTLSARAGEAYQDEPLEDIDWEQEMVGQGLSHNAAVPPQQSPAAPQPQSQTDPNWFNKIPRQYQEAVREAAQVVNRERGQLLQQLTANMNPQQKQYAVQKFGQMPIEDLRRITGMFAANSSIQAGPPPLVPIYPGAGGGPVNNVSGDPTQSQDAALPLPTMNFKDDEDQRRQNRGRRRR